MKIMKIIAFDLGSNMAWASGRDGRVTGHREFTGTRVAKFAAIQLWLTHLVWEAYDIVVYETPLGKGQAATRSLWGIAGILEATVTQAKLPIIDVAVPTIKKFATGHGLAPKTAMLAAARRFGYQGNNEHEADAVCLYHYAKEYLVRVAA